MTEINISSILHIDGKSKFGSSNVVKKVIELGKEHKEARQSQNKLNELFNSLGINHEILPEYLLHDFNHNVFNGVQFGQEKPQYVSIKQVNFENDNTTLNPIQIIGGTCIGGSETIIGLDSFGQSHSLLESDLPDKLTQPMKSVRYNPKVTAYEIDTIAKTSKFINIMLKNGMNQKHVSMFWHMPLPEYLLYLKQYLDLGVLDEKQSHNIATLLQKRASMLKNWLSKKIELNDIQAGSPLNNVIDLNFLFNKQYTLETVLSTLYQNNLWKKIIDFSPITTWTQLADASYSYLYLAASQNPNFLLGIENPEEAKILSQAKKIAESSNLSFSMTCLYPHPKNLEQKANPARLYRHEETNPSEALLIFNSY